MNNDKPMFILFKCPIARKGKNDIFLCPFEKVKTFINEDSGK